MKTDAQRIAHYNARMLSSLIDPTISQIQALAVANFGAYASAFYLKQQALRALLNGWGIATPLYFQYEAFNGEMYHVFRVAGSSPSAVVMATALVAKYVSFFLVAANLKEIALTVWGITVP
jgi:hypothetical protein